jgi:23S rRNA (cytosine1962-C5)-methyltransferase
MPTSQLTQWRLKPGSDRRFRSGHPWVYSNEIQGSPKGIEPGAEIELRDAGGKWLARGYGNPSSLISFRAVTRYPESPAPFTAEHLRLKLESAHRLRGQLGLEAASHRLCFGEADGLPGLIIDRYLTAEAQAYVIQAQSSGAQRWLDLLIPVLEKLPSPRPWSATAVIIRNDVGVRQLEGLAVEGPRLAKNAPGFDPRAARVLVRSASQGEPLTFNADLLEGQKTGFFLDQSANVELALQRLGGIRPARGALRILDLCCYVGQWGAQLARYFRAQGLEVEVTGVDSSRPALELAATNVEAQGARFMPLKGDVLKDLESLPAESFDLVIADPPALIKSRKDIPAGKHAYLQLNTQAVRLLRAGGGIVSCSCSALLEEEDFLAALSKAATRNQAVVRWVGRGAQAPDHPVLAEFPEGRYLKAWIGIRS